VGYCPPMPVSPPLGFFFFFGPRKKKKKNPPAQRRAKPPTAPLRPLVRGTVNSEALPADARDPGGPGTVPPPPLPFPSVEEPANLRPFGVFLGCPLLRAGREHLGKGSPFFFRRRRRKVCVGFFVCLFVGSGPKRNKSSRLPRSPLKKIRLGNLPQRLRKKTREGRRSDPHPCPGCGLFFEPRPALFSLFARMCFLRRPPLPAETRRSPQGAWFPPVREETPLPSLFRLPPSRKPGHPAREGPPLPRELRKAPRGKIWRRSKTGTKAKCRFTPPPRGSRPLGQGFSRRRKGSSYRGGPRLSFPCRWTFDPPILKIETVLLSGAPLARAQNQTAAAEIVTRGGTTPPQALLFWPTPNRTGKSPKLSPATFEVSSGNDQPAAQFPPVPPQATVRPACPR